MSYRLSARLYLTISLVIGICLSVVFLLGLCFSQAATPESLASLAATIKLVPDQMMLSGHVATLTNTIGYCPEPWLSDMPAGSIILGVKPTSCDPADWGGGSATANFSLPDLDYPTVLVLKLSWPDRDGKGLHSPERNRMGTITLDGQPLWGKRTTHLSTSNDYYAAEHEPILTTIVLTQSIMHTLIISVPARTAWDLSRIELSAYPYPTMTKGIGYSPYRDCQYPGGELQPSVQDLEEDLFRLFHTTNAIRTYSATGVNGQIPSLANAIGLPVYAGAWIDYPKTTLAQDDDEVQALIDLACTTDLEGVIVGNEYYLRHRTTDGINYLVQRIGEVRDGIRECGKDVPVTTAEIDNLMFIWESLDDFEPEVNDYSHLILPEIDFIMVHTYPFWNGMSIDGAAAFTVNRYKAIQGLIEREYPGQNKWVIIGEAGWPSAGATCYGGDGHSSEAGWLSAGGPRGPAMPSLKNQRCYMLEFLHLAEQEGVEYMYFDAFDELWKIEEPGRVGQNWGYSYFDRAAKHNFYGVLLPAEQLPESEHCSSCVVYLPYTASSGGSQTFPVYTEWPMGPGHFVPSGWMGGYTDTIGLYECDRADPHQGEMAIRATFLPTGTLGWGGIYWQYPENNWGDMKDGLDLSWANKLNFWAKGEEGGEKIRFFVGGIGTKDDPYPDSLRPALSTGFIQLEKEWHEYMIDLRGQDLAHVIGGFGWTTDQCANPAGATFYLDDIVFEFGPNMPPPPPSGPVFPVYTNAAAQDNHYFPTGWMGDGEVPGRVSLTECWYDNPHSRQTAIRIAYTEKVIGWAGIYWVHPAENWGDRPGGFDLTGADRLTFWARSDTPNARIEFLIGGIGYPNGTACSSPLAEPYSDSVCPKIQQTEILSSTWKKYTILLPQSRNLEKVVGGFGWVATDGVIFYLDDIVYEFE